MSFATPAAFEAALADLPRPDAAAIAAAWKEQSSA